MDVLKKLSKGINSRSLNELRLIVALERAVARLERHPGLSKSLVFKGGFVLLKTVDTSRFTRDVDALAVGISRPPIVNMMNDALHFDLDDGLWFGDVRAEDLKDQGPYGGYRFDCAFQLGDPPKEKSKIKKLSRLHIDVGFGDAVNFVPNKVPMPSVLDNAPPVSWSVYPLEFIFAEKLEALFSRGSSSSRAKDVYDLPLIFLKCDKKKLLMAIRSTFEIRNTPIPSSFNIEASSFDLSVLQAAWGSVDVQGGKATFNASWAALKACLNEIDNEAQTHSRHS
jgi:hypothetical protein